MLKKRLCTLTGFEPQDDALGELERAKSDLETYLPYAIGDGRAHTLRICRRNGMTSLLEPDPQTYEFFPKFAQYAMVVREVPIQTRRLDDVAEIEAIDFLKIDIQGSELSSSATAGRSLGARSPFTPRFPSSRSTSASPYTARSTWNCASRASCRTRCFPRRQ